jgi:transposase InsO family protein
VPPAGVQASLRKAFRRWGRPGAVRVDNGVPWGSSGDWPPDLALWLVGLGVDVSWNTPRRPQENGKVERSQGTGRRWAEPQTCGSVAELQARLEAMDGVQREEYPSIDGQSRRAAFPGLTHSGRGYSGAWERRSWDLTRVAAHLAGYAVVRRVDVKGQVSLYNRGRYVGQAYRGQDVFVTFDPVDHRWVASDAVGTQLRTWPAEEISRERITGLEVTHRR